MDSLICISFDFCGRWMFTNGRSELADLFRRWLVGELAVGTRLFVLFPSINVVVGCLQMVEARWPVYFGGG